MSYMSEDLLSFLELPYHKKPQHLIFCVANVKGRVFARCSSVISESVTSSLFSSSLFSASSTSGECASSFSFISLPDFELDFENFHLPDFEVKSYSQHYVDFHLFDYFHLVFLPDPVVDNCCYLDVC